MLSSRLTYALALVAVLVAPLAANAGACAAAPLRIGMVANTDGVYDRSFNELAYAGVRTAALKLGAAIDVRASPTALSYEPNLRFMAEQGYDLIIAIGQDEEQALASVARDYPAVRFAIVDDSYAAPALGSLPNVLGLRFQQQQAGYLAGYLAGLVERSGMPRLKRGNVISSIGGVRGPSVDRYLAGFQAGALAADPTVRLIQAYSNSESSVARCHTLALSQIAAGSDIVFPAAGACSAGALQAGAERGVWTLGTDADRSYLGPSVLASAVLRADQAVLLAIYAVHDGTFAGGRDVEFGIAQNALGIAGINVAVPRGIRLRLKVVANRLRAGRISIPTAFVPLSS